MGIDYYMVCNECGKRTASMHLRSLSHQITNFIFEHFYKCNDSNFSIYEEDIDCQLPVLDVDFYLRQAEKALQHSACYNNGGGEILDIIKEKIRNNENNKEKS